ncbi:uncharacterized protein [Polyergus mexicanus]|uniref:uncharacterized protein isoform X2 n=1 Tax=Polyergus mexicanus TaxID=615972 RepID=UPI0038B4A2F8
MDSNKEVARKLHQSFKRKAQRNRICQEIKRRRLENIKALIEYQNVASSDGDNRTDSETSDTTEEQYIILSDKDGSLIEDNVQVENENLGNQAIEADAFQLHIAQNENSPATGHPNEAEDFNSSDDDLLIFENDEERQQYVIESLSEWALESENVSMKKLDNLLNRLHPAFPSCPKSNKTLLNTPSSTPVIDFESGGRFWYKGIEQNLNALGVGEYLLRYGEITIDINMDGLPVSNSSTLKFWPMLEWI